MGIIDTSNWKSFKIVDIFYVNNTHSILKSDIEFDSGDIPYVTASDSNNAVASYISAEADIIEKGNSILIGGKTMAISYQKDDFVSNDSHNLLLELKDSLHRTEAVQLFLVSALRSSFGWKYKWSDSISKKAIQNDIVFLPATKTGEPDWDYMEGYMGQVEKRVKDSLLIFEKIINIPKSINR